jgi:hypothetical protein
MSKNYRTNRPLWAALSIVLFVVIGWVTVLPFGKTEMTYWGLAAGWAENGFEHPELFVFFVFWAAVFAVPAAGLGWIAQALFVLLRDRVRRTSQDAGNQHDSGA